MKKLILYLFPFCLLLMLASCTIEKRVYRNGWYAEKSKQRTSSENEKPVQAPLTTTEILPELKLSNPDSIVPGVANPTPGAIRAEAMKKRIAELRKAKKELQKDSLARMSYDHARMSMAKKGCTPNKSAMTVYYLSMASLISLFIGFGFLLALITLIASIFAINKVVADGSCVEENIAIIKAGRRICWGIVIGLAVLTFLVLGILLGILLLTFGYNG